MIIDLHTHFVPEHFPPEPASGCPGWPSMQPVEPGRANVMIDGKNFRTVTDQAWNATRRLRDVQLERPEDAQVVSPMPELLSYWLPIEHGRAIARHVNEQLARLVEAGQGHFFGLGMVPLQDPELAARELAEIRELGLAGIEVGSNIEGVSLGDARFADFFAEVERLDLSVFVHALHPTTTDRYPGHPMLVNAIGFPIEMGLTIGSIIASGLLDRCPRLRLAFSQSGGALASMLPRWQYIWSGGNQPRPADAAPTALQRVMPRSPIDYARSLYYDTLQTDVRAIRYLMDSVGRSQLAVATDYPFVPREQPLGKTAHEAASTDAEWTAISHANVQRFLGLGREEPATC